MDDLKKYLKKLYGSKSEELASEIHKLIEQTEKITPQFVNKEWYKHIALYVVYPDGIFHRNCSAFDSLITHLDHIKQMGFQAIHVLPFLESPMVDKGFDISDYFKIRKDLGNINDLKRFKKAADEKGLRVFMDLVFNHVSDQHEWFKKAEAGDEKYRKYFITTKEKPKFIRTYHKDAAVWAEYEINGEKKSINIAFPEQAGEIPHWREGKDGYWYYHTYYPQQLDVNWQNPEVFLEFSKILVYWTSLGFNFRLDAIPFVGQGPYKETDDNHKETYLITASLNAIANAINPESAFIVETYEKLETVIDYFGSSNLQQAELSYNFHLCTYIWVTLVTQDADYLIKKLNGIHEIPIHAEWINFLRNHDELSLAYLSDQLKDEISNEILKYGAPFREGYGISGRVMSLLGNSKKRFLMAYFLLTSLPGSMAIVYGDEFGAKNIPFKKLSETDKKDTRNINRGTITKEQMDSKPSKDIEKTMQKLLENHRILRNYINVWPKLYKLDKEDKKIISLQYSAGASELIIFINLSDKEKEIMFDSTNYKKVSYINNVKYNSKIHLGPYAGIWLQK